MPVVVVTDSSASLEPELVERYGIRVVPLHVLAGDEDLREGIDPVPADLTGVTTSGASQNELSEAYAEALDSSGGAGVLAVHISRQLSATWEAGRQAAQKFGGNVRIIDSQSTGMGLGYPVLEAARAAKGGAALETVYRRAVDVASRGHCLIVVDKLDQLRRGGRIGTAAALLGTALAMKPVLHLVDGRLVLKEKTRTGTKAVAKMVDAAVEYAGQGRTAIAVHHMDARRRADAVAAQLKDRIPQISDIVVTDFSAVIGAHVGVGAVGIVLCPEPSVQDEEGDSSTTPD
ncbi:fatty acid-binding protein DegV [Rhodococcus sp. WMMA185]|uniref:DegV family protein n=1 Tax=Rhodococcus sp. WMMA185 TaxID=679318 RepID=UPI000878E07E|nr:DegV family protein [Rhodococcus sp. WMMA185]AOW92953.1 fatty acid-binding protein DegV [Rhodococcus sp. WMMA185]